ncbi:DUF6285 domain-containing protein [Sphingopyxis sp. Q841]|uniref:DUF6285 domain-containing protein n=1 Tax=Sphingopyxis sp. Q841 TaxID=3458250 RepID=UPI0040361C63
MPKLAGGDAFNVRVTANALDLVRREIALRADAEEKERTLLVAALKREGDIYSLRDELCDLVASGPTALADPLVRSALRETVLDRLAIDQPSYSGYVAGRS